MDRETIINAILFFLIGLVLGLSSQFVFSLFDYCVYNQVSISYMLALGSIAISFFIYIVTTKQTDDIESQTKDIKKVSADILILNKELNTAILGQAKGFEELFNKIHEILSDVNNHESSMKLVLPIPTLGFFNKQVRPIYNAYKKILLELCSSNKQIELIFLNPFIVGSNNKVLSFFKSIIEISNKDSALFESGYKKNILELITFYTEIAQSCGWHENISIKFIDDIFLSGVTASNGGYKSSLFFFIGPELIESQVNIEVDKQDYLSTAVYNNTAESYALLNNLIDIQKSKTNTLNVFNHIAPDLFCCLMKQVSKKIEIEEGDSTIRIDSIIEEYSNIFNNLNLKYEKLDNAHLFIKNKKNNKNILILPSAAGLYSHFNHGVNHNVPRFNIYNEILNELDSNCYLFSYSGQGFVKNDGEFSLQKGIVDLKKLSDYFKKINVKIDCILSFCVSNQIYFNFCETSPGSSLSNLPLIIWDLPAFVSWKNNGWFKRAFSHININLDDFYNTVEPIEALPVKFDNKILYCYPHLTYNDRDYDSMKIELTKITTELDYYEYEKLKHIPSKLDDVIEFNEFISKINSF